MNLSPKPSSRIKIGIFLLGFSSMDYAILLILRYFVVPRYINPFVDIADPRGMDGILLVAIIPFWILISILSGMVIYNVLMRLNKSKNEFVLTWFSILGYIIFSYGIGLFVYSLARPNS